MGSNLPRPKFSLPKFTAQQGDAVAKDTDTCSPLAKCRHSEEQAEVPESKEA